MNVWEKIKEFFKSDFDKQLEQYPNLIKTHKEDYRKKLKDMSEKELLEEICYQLKF